MSENIHNDDDELYRKAYHNFEQEPSPEVWNKLNARLDQKDAALYRTKFTLWKRVAVVLVFLLGSAAAYEIFFKAGNSSTPKTADAKQTETAIDSALQQPSFPKQTPKNTANLNNKEAASTQTPAGQSNKKQVPVEDDKTVVAIPPAQTKKQRVSADKTAITQRNSGDIAKHKDNWLSVEQLGRDATLPGNHQPEDLNYSSKNEQATPKDKKEAINQTPLPNDSTLSNDSAVFNQHNDSILTNSKKLDSANNSIEATTRKSPIKTKKYFKSYISLSPYIAADFTGHQIDNDEHHRDPGRRDEQDEIEKREDNQSSFSAGVFVRYQVSKNISLKSGLGYFNTTIHINPETLYATPDNNQSVSYKYISSLGYAYVKPSFDQSPSIGDSIRSGNAEQHAGYVSIPLMVNYTINAGKKLSLLPGVGFTTNWLLGSKIQTAVKKNNVESNITINKLQGLAPVYFSFATEVELNYQLSNKLSLMLLPSFKYAFVPVTANHVVKTYPYNYGVGLGIRYKL